MSKSFDEWYKDQKEFQKEWAEQELGIVRCKDCKYWDYEVDNDVGFCTRTEDCDWNADDFCSRGKRKKPTEF